MALVLVHNDVVANPEAHNWDDREGVQYHYPAKYRSKIRTGESFVYYRGVHRADGKRGSAEYVGTGKIGVIWPDENRKNAWYCAVEDYERFPVPVPAKRDGMNLEVFPASRSNLWRDGVRGLDQTIYEEILALSSELKSNRPLIGSEAATIAESGSLILPPSFISARGERAVQSSRRLSRNAKVVGDWAEQVALRFIRENFAGSAQLVHRAANGETPGWDIDYIDASGTLQRVEVKGTVAAAFAGIELTANELSAAEACGLEYAIFLVANCLTEAPQVQVIRDPISRLRAGDWHSIPILYSVKFA